MWSGPPLSGATLNDRAQAQSAQCWAGPRLCAPGLHSLRAVPGPRRQGRAAMWLHLVFLPLRWASGGLGEQWASCCCCCNVPPSTGTAIWARGLGKWPAGHLPAWSWLLPKGSGAPARAGVAGGGLEAVPWPGQPVRPQAAVGRPGPHGFLPQFSPHTPQRA